MPSSWSEGCSSRAPAHRSRDGRPGPDRNRAGAGSKPGQLVDDAAELALRGGKEYVSRGGHKLASVLDSLEIRVEGRRWLDVGISTGGFTDCLLQRGAAHVVGVDVAYGQVAWSSARTRA